MAGLTCLNRSAGDKVYLKTREGLAMERSTVAEWVLMRSLGWWVVFSVTSK